MRSDFAGWEKLKSHKSKGQHYRRPFVSLTEEVLVTPLSRLGAYWKQSIYNSQGNLQTER